MRLYILYTVIKLKQILPSFQPTNYKCSRLKAAVTAVLKIQLFRRLFHFFRMFKQKNTTDPGWAQATINMAVF